MDIIDKSISEIYRHSQIIINHYLKPYGIGSGQFIFLINIYKNEGVSQKELTKLVKIDKATTAKALKKLEEVGYIYRETDMEDKRYYKIYLTEKGRNFMPILFEKLKQITQIESTGMTKEQYMETIKCLDMIFNNLQRTIERLKIE